jgi:uncharacterized protein YgbK (DUF1537 family)
MPCGNRWSRCAGCKRRERGNGSGPRLALKSGNFGADDFFAEAFTMFS